MSTRDEILKKLEASLRKGSVASDIILSIEEIQEQREQELADLRAKSKPLEKLIVSANFNVERVLCKTYNHLITPHSERIYGGRSPEYKAGFSNSIFLDVVPDKKDILVRRLIFDGASSVRGGDYVRVKIPRYEEKRPKCYVDPEEIEDLHFIFDRDFQEEERAIEIEILSFGGKVLRVDRSVDYKYFVGVGL